MDYTQCKWIDEADGLRQWVNNFTDIYPNLKREIFPLQQLYDCLLMTLPPFLLAPEKDHITYLFRHIRTSVYFNRRQHQEFKRNRRQENLSFDYQKSRLDSENN